MGTETTRTEEPTGGAGAPKPVALAALAACALLFVAYFWPLFTATALESNGDIACLFLPAQVVAARALQEGAFPQWNPWTFCGTPFHASMQAGLAYPPNWPLRLVGDPEAFGVAAVNAARLLHLALLLAGIVWLLRREYGTSLEAALLAAVALGGSGYIASHLSHLNQLETVAWTPWIVGCARRLVRRREMRAALALGGFGALAILAGHPQNLYYTGLFCAVGIVPWWLARHVGPDDDDDCPLCRARRAAVTGVIVVLAAIFALALAAIQIIPTMEASTLSWITAEGADYAAHLALPPIGLLGYVAPWYFGNATDGPRAGLDDWAFHEWGLYFGLLPLALAVVGLVVALRGKAGASTVDDAPPPTARSLSRGEAIALSAAWFLAALFALGDATPLFGLVTRTLPLMESLRVPPRALLLGHLALVIFAAHGFDALAARLARPRAALFAAALVLTAADLFLASRGAEFRHPVEYTARPDPRIAHALDAALGAHDGPHRVFWMVRDDLYFLKGSAAHTARAWQLTPNANAVAGHELTHGYGESLQPTLRFRDFLYTFNRNFFAARPDVDLLRALNCAALVTDIDAPIDLGGPPAVTVPRPGLAPVRVFAIPDPLPRVLDADGPHAALADDLGALDGSLLRTGRHETARGTEAVAWRAPADAAPAVAPTVAASGRIVLDPPTWNRQPFRIEGGPVRSLLHLTGAYPGWRLRRLGLGAPTWRDDPTPISAVAWRADGPFDPGDYAFVFAPRGTRLAALLSLAALAAYTLAWILLQIRLRGRRRQSGPCA